MTPDSPPASSPRPGWMCAAIFLVTLAAYWPALNGGLLWDDAGHVTRPALQSVQGLRRIWLELGATQQYYPVLHSAFWIEHRLWGDSPTGYHLINVFLHATAACLFGLALRKLGTSEGAAWLAAFIFALHPVGVESVAWISEQKNTLSTVFYLLAALAYLRFDRQRGLAACATPAGRSSTSGLTPYSLATLFFLLALLSKSVTATLPAALLVVLWWRRGRLSWERDVMPLLPWFAVGAAAGFFTSWVERTYIGAEGVVFSLTWLQHGLLAGRIICFYLGKLLWPADLIFIYPHWTVDPAAVWPYAFPLAVAALGLALWTMRRRSRGPLAALLFFVGTLLPALGFLNVYPFVFSYVADHFQYLASLGFIAAAAAAWERWFRRSALLAAALLCLLGVLTWRQARTYRDRETLYRATLERNPASWLAHDNLGIILAQAGRLPEAIDHFDAALRLNPGYATSYYNLANALAKTGRLPEAISAYREAVRLVPDYAEAHNNLGVALVISGQLSAAVAEYEQVLRLRPDHVESRFNLASILVRLNRPAEAVPYYEAALRLRPELAEAHAGLAGALASMGRLPEAITQYETALRLRPGDGEIQRALNAALQALARKRGF